jgi:hypothetical protein
MAFLFVFSVLPLNWTVGMVGILAGTIEDAFIVSVFFILSLLIPPRTLVV